MKQGVRLVAIAKLRAHERVRPQRLLQVKEMIRAERKIHDPVVVDRQTGIILDGHHRVESLRQLGCQLVPVMEVDYLSNQVRVVARREEYRGKDLKGMVLRTALGGKCMPPKSTKHLVSGRVRGVGIPIIMLNYQKEEI